VISNPQTKRDGYATLHAQALALLAGERNWLANLSQFAALVFNELPDLNWAGFYRAEGRELVLGPFQGKVACVRIPFDRGVCGACARTGEIQIVPDVHAFEGHIACDSASRSELVLPLFLGTDILGVFDLDSPSLGRFGQDDARGLTRLLDVLVAGTDWPAGN
jgi:L-methionine (R)-S-oxide reductase